MAKEMLGTGRNGTMGRTGQKNVGTFFVFFVVVFELIHFCQKSRGRNPTNMFVEARAAREVESIL